MGLGELWTLIGNWLNGDVLIIGAALSALGLALGAYFKSGAADGRFTVEDLIAIAVIAVTGTAVVYGILR